MDDSDPLNLRLSLSNQTENENTNTDRSTATASQAMSHYRPMFPPFQTNVGSPRYGSSLVQSTFLRTTSQQALHLVPGSAPRRVPSQVLYLPAPRRVTSLLSRQRGPSSSRNILVQMNRWPGAVPTPLPSWVVMSSSGTSTSTNVPIQISRPPNAPLPSLPSQVVMRSPVECSAPKRARMALTGGRGIQKGKQMAAGDGRANSGPTSKTETTRRVLIESTIGHILSMADSLGNEKLLDSVTAACTTYTNEKTVAMGGASSSRVEIGRDKHLSPRQAFKEKVKEKVENIRETINAKLDEIIEELDEESEEEE